MPRRLRLLKDRIVLEQSSSSRCVSITLDTSAPRKFSAKVVDKASVLPDAGGSSGNSVVVDAVFGFYQLLSGPFIAVVLDSEVVINGIPDINFRRVTKVAILPVFSKSLKLTNAQKKDEDRYLHLLHAAISQHQFYFSYNTDVTHTLQRAVLMTGSNRAKPIAKRADDRFFWNKSVVQELEEANAYDWVTPMMSAYVEARTGLQAAGLSFTLLFISRRSRYRQGCRFTKRGVDAAGNVANFVETEQALLFSSGARASYVQVRGSIPLLWSSPVTMKYAPKVRIDSNVDRHRQAFQRHLDGLFKDFDEVLMVNLIDKKKDQGRLGKEFEDNAEYFSKQLQGSKRRRDEAGRNLDHGGAQAMASRGGQDDAGKDGGSGDASDRSAGAASPAEPALSPLQFLWFDFHKECAKMKWNHLSRLFERKGDIMLGHGWFQTDESGRIMQTQRGVVRTNCMDNLDRTNVVQSVIARKVTVRIFASMGAAPELMLKADQNVLETPFPAFERVYKDVWGNNADAMSLLYSGTGALKTDFTRTGKRTFRGILNDGWNSTMRFYINNFLDGERQDGIDLMIGRFVPSIDSATPFAPRAGQETIPGFMTKLVVLAMVLFSALSLAGPQDVSLHRYVAMALGTTAVIWMTLMFLMVKKGSTGLGRRLVVHPRLCPEPF